MSSATPPPFRAAFSQRLRETRAPRGFKTARMLAQALGIDENRYTRYERAEVEPDLELLARICRTLGTTPNELLGFIAEHPAPTGLSEEASTYEGNDRAGQPAEGEGVVDTAVQKRRTLAWRLAQRVASLETEADAKTEALSVLQNTGRIYSQIEADPYAFVAAFSSSVQLLQLPTAEQEQLATLMDDLVGAAQRAANG